MLATMGGGAPAPAGPEPTGFQDAGDRGVTGPGSFQAPAPAAAGGSEFARGAVGGGDDDEEAMLQVCVCVRERECVCV